MSTLDPELLKALEDAGLYKPGKSSAEKRHFAAPSPEEDSGSSPEAAAQPVRVLVQFTGDPEKLRQAGMNVEAVMGEIVVGSIPLGLLETVAAVEGVIRIQSSHTRRPALDKSVPAIHADVLRGAPMNLNGSGVVVGVIDTGIDICHQNFRKPDESTRILFLWDQTLTPETGESSPSGFSLGVEFDADKIRDGMADCDSTFRSVDEDGHGTHVAGIAAGDGSQSGNCHGGDTFIGVAPQADLIIVKTTFETADIILGALYIAQKAGTKPFVINLSLGGDLGPHDGTEDDEVALSALAVAAPGRAVVVASGNEANDGIHIHKTVTASGNLTLTFRVRAESKEADFIDLWYGGPSRLNVQLTDPNGNASSTISPAAGNGNGGNQSSIPGNTVNIRSRLSVPPATYPDGSARNRHNIRIILTPPTDGQVTTGDWQIALTETAGTPADVHGWINFQDDTFPQWMPESDRQSSSTCSSPGTAFDVITVGAYDPEDNSLASFSGCGPTVDESTTDPNGRRKPDVVAPGVGITSARSKERSSWYCCDCCQDFYLDLPGTSMATPHVTGVVALMLQRNRTLTSAQLREHIRTQADAPDPITAPTLPNNQWGHGILNAQKAAASMPPAPGGGGGAPIPFSISSSDSASAGPSSQLFLAEAQDPPGIYPATARQLRRKVHLLQDRLAQTPAGQLVMALVSTHVDEVLRLVNTNRRIATIWHRMSGPQLLRRLADLPLEEEPFVEIPPVSAEPLLPLESNGRPLNAHLQRLLRLLTRYGSVTLQSDIQRYGSLVLTLPGKNLSEILSMGEDAFVSVQVGSQRTA